MNATFQQGEFVKYKRQGFLFMGVTSTGCAKLMKPDNDSDHVFIYSGTPSLSKLSHTGRKFPVKHYNGHSYALTTRGIYSLSSGNLIKSKTITKLFLDEIKKHIKSINVNLIADVSQT